jgi:signal transduction histidine kinase
MDQEEEKRLEALRSYRIVDTLPEEDYDNLTSIAAHICGTKISLVTLVDAARQWFKSTHGMPVRETPREYSFCAHAIQQPEDIFVIEDARRDNRFKDNPYVVDDPHIVFYAGVPLTPRNGPPLGTLCVIDDVPRELSAEQVEALRALSKQVGKLLELRRTNWELDDTVRRLTEKNEELNEFAKRAAHDIRSPLSTIVQTIDLMQYQYSDRLSTEVAELTGWMSQSAYRLIHMIEGLLEHSRSDRLLSEASETVSLSDIREELEHVIEDEAFSRFDGNHSLQFHTDVDSVWVNSVALKQVLRNLASNSVKYCDKDEVRISVRIEASDGEYRFWFSDNGPGIPREYHDEVFQVFRTVHPQGGEQGNEQGEDHGNDPGNEQGGGTGIGLATVKKLIEGLGGSIEVLDADPGTTFRFTVPAPSSVPAPR